LPSSGISSATAPLVSLKKSVWQRPSNRSSGGIAAAQAAGAAVDADGAGFIACRFAAQSGRA